MIIKSEEFKEFLEDLHQFNFEFYSFLLSKDHLPYDYVKIEYGKDMLAINVSRIQYINYLFEYIKLNNVCNFYEIKDCYGTTVFNLEKISGSRDDDKIRIIITKFDKYMSFKESFIIYPYKFNNYGIRKCKIHIYRLLEWII